MRPARIVPGDHVRVIDGRDEGFAGDVLTVRRPRGGAAPVALVSDWSGRVVEARLGRLEHAPRREGAGTGPTGTTVELTERGES